MAHTTAFSTGLKRPAGTSSAADDQRAGKAQAVAPVLRRNLVGFGLFLTTWAVAALFFPAYILPSPVAVLGSMPARLDAAFLHHLGVTVGRVGMGFGAALVLGTVLGVGGHLLNVTEQLRTLMSAQQVIPGTILGIVFLLLFGVGGGTAIALVCVLTLPLVAINTASGLAKTDQDLIEVLISLGGGKRDLVRYLYVPTLLPSFGGTLTLGFGLALKVAILGEYVGAQDGLGYLLNAARVYFRMEEVFFYLFIVLLLTLAFQILQSLIFSVGLRRYLEGT
jgi:NitT/TauT family transport system permease protein